MFGWAIARAGLPGHFAVFGMMATGLILALLMKGAFEALLGVIGDGFRWLYYGLPSDWVSTPMDGTMVMMTNTGRMLRDLERSFSNPDDGLLVVLSIGLYMLLELMALGLFVWKTNANPKT